MLVLSRKLGEQIVIDDGRIVITVVRLGPGQVRLGIEAPADVKIIRPDARDQGPKGTDS